MLEFNKTRPWGSLIAEKNVFKMLFYFSCSSVGNPIISKKQTYMSQKSLLSSVGLNFLSHKLSEKGREVFQIGVYASFEMRLAQEMTSPRFPRGLIGETKLACAEEARAFEQKSSISLGFKFFNSINIFYLWSLPLSFLIFFVKMGWKYFAG